MRLWKECFELNEKGESFVMVTLTAHRGSAPQDPGAKMLVTTSGLYAGTVGGGKVEMAAIKKAAEILNASTQQPPLSLVWNLQTEIGMSCGGEVSFLFEHFMVTSWPIVIFGAGHVAQALSRILSKLNCSITCVDPREEWLSKFEGVKVIQHPDPKQLIPSFDPKSFFLVMTMGHAYDVPILLDIAKLAPNAPYVGVIGSDIKGMKIRKELAEAGVSQDFIDKLKCPMGLDLGSNHPYEIAISISAQLLQVRGAD
jgi:xanthine dehydrogenase accessory factor